MNPIHPHLIEIAFHPEADADLMPLVQELHKKGQLATVVKSLMRLHIGKPATLTLMEKLYAVESALLAQLNGAGQSASQPPLPPPPRKDDPLLDNL